MQLKILESGFGLHRLRYQILSGLIIAILFPFALRFMLLTPDEPTPPLYIATICSTVALFIGIWILRNVATYPGAEASAYVVPAISGAFLLLFTVLIIGRIPYNRTLILLSWIMAMLWYSVLYARVQRDRQLKIGVVPPCDPEILAGISTIEAIPLTNPTTIERDIDAVMADLRVDLPAAWDAALADYALAGIPVYHLKHLTESLTGRVELEHLSENSFGSLTPLTPFMVCKRAIDWIFALVIGLVLLPALMIVALIIRLTSPGPALFQQQRMGYRGKPFTVFKFRTMAVSTTSTSEREAAMTRDSDTRVTQLGHFLRRSRIDELPQILNILRGEMSWIGPRPEAEILSKWYESEIPFYRYRHIVRPGITGWAQVNQGHVTNVDEVKEKLYYDFYYIKNFSLWIDMLILVRTGGTIISGFGAR